MDRLKQARIAALSLEQGTVLVRLLNASGRSDHATHLEAALREAREILSREFGHAVLSDAIDWVAEKSGTRRDLNSAVPPIH